MQKKDKILIALILIVIVWIVGLFINISGTFSGGNNNLNKMTTLSLDNYQVGYMIESGDFMLWNRKTNTIDYCIKDSLSKTIYLQIMKVDQLNYNQYFEKSKEKKK